jgi:hypothetical protein
MLSVVVPAEPKSENVKESLLLLKSIPGVEVVVVGTDEGFSRAERMNIGFHRSKGQIVLFHHPRSCMELSGIKYLAAQSLDNRCDPFWGGFTHEFDLSHPILRFTSWYSNKLRAKRGVVYLDHGIFLNRQMWKNDLPKVDIFEDTLLSYQLLRVSKPTILPYRSTTSAIRFQENGMLKQALVNQVVKIGFHLKFSHSLMNRFYEKGMELNSKYSIAARRTRAR